MNDLTSLLGMIQRDAGLTELLKIVEARTSDDPGHDIAHSLRVALWTIRLASTEVPARHAVAAALLHDLVNVPKNDPQRAQASELSARAARELLPASGFTPDEIDCIAAAIRDHSYSRGARPTTPLAAALQDADRLEAIGAIGVFRAVTCGGRIGAKYFDMRDPWAQQRTLDDAQWTVDHFFTKLLALPETLISEAGRREARRRVRFMIRFLEQMGTEIGVPVPQEFLDHETLSS